MAQKEQRQNAWQKRRVLERTKSKRGFKRFKRVKRENDGVLRF